MDKLLNVENISKAGIIGLLLLILVTGSTGVWVWGTTYTEVKAERDEWKKTALDGLKVAREVSAVRVPIMAAPPTASPADIRPEDVKAQLDIVKSFNDSNEE